jgi:hypothetical protein
MIKYMATRQLLGNLADIRYLSSSAHRDTIEIPEIPAKLRAKLESMGLAKEIAAEQDRMLREPAWRITLKKTFSAAPFPAFSTPELAHGIGEVLADAPRDADRVAAPIAQLLGSAEREMLATSIGEEIEAASMPFSEQDDAQIADTLVPLVATAKLNTQFKKLVELISDETIDDLTLDQRKKILALLDARKAAYEAGIPRAAIRAWVEAARRSINAMIYDDQRDAFVQDVLVRAPLAVARTRAAYAGDTVDPSLLAQVYSNELYKMAPSDEASGWLREIYSQPDWLQARAKFNEIILRELGKGVHPELVATEIVNEKVAADLIDRGEFAPKARRALPPAHGLWPGR